MPRQKRARIGTSVGILKGTWSALGPPRSLWSGFPSTGMVITRRGAERLTASNTQGIYSSPCWELVSSRTEVEAADGGPTWVERRVVDKVFTTMTPRCSNKKRQTSSSISLGNSRRVFIVVQKQPRRLRDQVPPSPGHPVQLLVNFKCCCNAGVPLGNPLLRPMWIFLRTGGLFGGTGRIQPINSSASHQRRL